MKCPKCSHNQKVKYGMKCGKCSYRFTFNPKEASFAGMTDGKFLGHIRAADRGGTTYFTRNQLYGAYCRRVKSNRVGCFLAVLVLGTAGGVLLASGGVLLGGLLLAICGLIAVISFFSKPKVVSPKEFSQLIQRWRKDGKKIEHLLEGPSLHAPPREWSEPDIYDYGVERILVVERDVIVDLFVRNNQHAEQRMLVIAESGYPKYLVPQVWRLLEESPDLPVFLLHDATPDGVRMAERVQRSSVLPVPWNNVVDLGLFPEDFRRLKRTARFHPQDKQRMLPVDAVPLAFLATGMTASFASSIPLGEQLQRDAQNQATAGSSFG